MLVSNPSIQFLTTDHESHESPIPSVTLDNGDACSMNAPSESPDAHRSVRPSSSPVDSPYTSARSLSGHLIPYSPIPARHYSRDNTLWITATSKSQIPLHEEPGLIDHGTSQGLADSVLRTNSSVTIHAYDDSRISSPDNSNQPFHIPSPHRVISVGLEQSPGSSGINPFLQAPHVQFGSENSEPHRSKTPVSIKSNSQRSFSQRSTSQKSFNSRMSTGRASYRTHRGPPARVRTPVPDQSALAFDQPIAPVLNRAEPGDSAFPGISIALPSADDPTRPGNPVDIGLRFFPMSVTSVRRYENRKIRSPTKHNYQISAMLYQYPETPSNVPEGWTAYRHPEGALYFVHVESKTFTEVDISDKEIHDDIEYFREFLFSELRTEIKDKSLSGSLEIDEIELVLEPKLDEEGVMCCYYFVSPSTRSLFWLDEWEGYEIFKDCKGELSLAHKGLAIQAHYWYGTYLCLMDQWSDLSIRSHWDLFPNFCKITQELKDEIVDMILHATCDHLTSNRSSCPLNPEELKNHLALIDRIDPEKTERYGRGHCAIIIGRIMHTFYNNYFLNFYGEDCARLNFDQTVHGWKYHPSLFMSILTPLLFMTPMSNVRLLHKIFVDDIASKDKWNMFVDKLNSQLQETSVLATVLLNANVAFLPKQSGTGTSPQQFLSYGSLVVSIASIILGLVFMGHSRTEARNTPFEAAKFLHGLRHDRHGLETLAIIYSLPHAFLIWGMVFFFAACAVQWCIPGDTTSRASVGIFMLMVAFMVAWCIWIARDQCSFWWFQPNPEEQEFQEENDSVASKIPSSSFLHRFITTFSGKFVAKSPSSEIHVMQESTSVLPSMPRD